MAESRKSVGFGLLALWTWLSYYLHWGSAFDYSIRIMMGRAWWLTLVIATFWDAEVSELLEARCLRPAWAIG